MVVKFLKALFLVALGAWFFPYSLIAVGVFLAFLTFEEYQSSKY
jgi:hypothetical protein